MISRRDFLKMSLSAAVLTSVPFGAEAFSGYGMTRPVMLHSLSAAEDITRSAAYYRKIANFNSAFIDDLVASEAEFSLIKSCQAKTRGLLRYVGFGNFNILNFDDAMKYMGTGAVPVFTSAEIDYLEMLFARDASEYGFYGERIFEKLTDRVDESEMVKVPHSGHYIYKSKALSTYTEITREMQSLTLTSGVRSVMKQLHLFLTKAIETDGNLSMASRSIAPVGYSYHGIGDFDVGIRGWGVDNFTDKFATTREYSRLIDKGYMRIRYDRTNPYGVRFEPWHVKVV